MSESRQKVYGMMMIRRLELWHSFQIIKTYQFAFNFLLISAYHFHRLQRVSKMYTICMNCIRMKNNDYHMKLQIKPWYHALFFSKDF